MNYRPERPDNPTPMPLAIEACATPCPDIEHLLGPAGPIAQGMPGWQDRPGQRRLAQVVRRALKQRLHALTEGATGVGKCLHGDTLITLADGRQECIADLVGQDVEILSLSEGNYGMRYARTARIFESGRKRVYKLRTQSGREITASKDHRFLTGRGWMPLESLCLTDRIVSVRVAPEPVSTAGIPEHELSFLALMIADGYLGNQQSISYTKHDPVVVEEYKRVTGLLDNCLATVYGGNQFGVVREVFRDNDGHHRNGAYVLLESHGLLGKTSHHKNLSPQLMKLPNAQTAYFLGRLWTGDGWVSKSVIGYASASQCMVRQVQWLLQRFGIIGRVRRHDGTCNGKTFENWCVEVLGSEQMGSFARIVGPHLLGPKAEKCRQILTRLTVANPNEDLLPRELTDSLLLPLLWAVPGRQPRGWATLRKRFNINSDRARELSLEKMRQIADWLQQPALHDLTKVYWDRVVAIETAGHAPTYDITMFGEPNFVANGLVVHNSQALLVPAILHALETNRPVVVSTRTILLQGQYTGTDLPLLQRLLTPWLQQKFGRTFTFARQMGLGRYLCEAKAARSSVDLEEWRAATVDGEIGDRALTAERTECPGTWCLRVDECWFYSAKRAAAQADIVVVNHALLLAAARADVGTVLPAWDALVVDEAHTLHEEATSALGITLSTARVRKLSRQSLAFCGDHRQGLLADRRDPACSCLELHDACVGTCAEPEPVRAHSPTLEGIEHEAGRFFAALEHATRREARDGAVRLRPDEHVQLTAALEHLEELISMLRRLALDVESTGEWHAEESEANATSRTLAQSIRDLCGELHTLRHDRPGYVAELQLGSESITVRPIDVSEWVKDALWKRAPAVLSSATLATEQGEKAFAYVSESLGIRTLHQVQVPSPFDWPRQAWLYLPEEGLHEGLLRGATESGMGEYSRVTALHLREVLRYTQGRALCLYTSDRAMRAHMAQLQDLEFPFLAQGEMGQADTIEWFRATPRAVLFALASYWEGLDVPMACVYVDRMPFPPPSDLLMQARMDALGRRGFAEVALPAAVVRLRQAIGRLIRRVTDRGIAVLPDPRLRGKHSHVLEALPPARRVGRAQLRQLPWHLAAAGEPVEGDQDVADALRGLAASGVPDAEHQGYLERMVARLPLLTPGLWRAGAWLCERYQAILERSHS